jgi:hypothetical protein
MARNGRGEKCPIAAFQPSQAGLPVDAGYQEKETLHHPPATTSLIAAMSSWLSP